MRLCSAAAVWASCLSPGFRLSRVGRSAWGLNQHLRPYSLGNRPWGSAISPRCAPKAARYMSTEAGSTKPQTAAAGVDVDPSAESSAPADDLAKELDQDADSLAGIASAFFAHSTGRWLFNDEAQKAMRYTIFNIQGLVKTASDTIDAPDDVLAQMSKLGNEENENKTFLIKYTHGPELVGRIPTRLVGNTELATASEVATLDYLRNHAQVNVPKVLAWSKPGQTNKVNTNYIVMERMPGETLQDRWPKLTPLELTHTVSDVVAMQTKLFGWHNFSQIGSLYFKEDVSPELQQRQLYPEDKDLDGEFEKTWRLKEAADKYRIGPIADPLWWKGRKILIKADRGPFSDMASYITAAVELQQEFISNLTDEDINIGFHRSKKEDIPVLMDLLDRVSAIAPHLVPDTQLSSTFTFTHPDLESSNLLVAPEGTPNMVGLVDWQGTTIGPLVMQAAVPRFCQYDSVQIELNDEDNQRPEIPYLKDRPTYEQKYLVDLYKQAYCLWTYRTQVQADWRQAKPLEQSVHIQNLVRTVLRCWSDGPLDLRTALVGITRTWAASHPQGDMCPIEFSKEELSDHDGEAVLVGLRQAVANDIAGRMAFDPGSGYVKDRDYDKLQELLKASEEFWENNGPGQALSPYPYKDGQWSRSLA